jgi:hypothetical protein
MMKFEHVLAEINTFWHGDPIPFGGGGAAEVARVQSLFPQKFPDELEQYIGAVLPPTRMTFKTVGNPLEIYGYRELSTHLPGYSENSITDEPIVSWSPGWLLIGDEGADPVIVDLNGVEENAPYFPVWQAWHGTGSWDFEPIADSLPQFLLLAAYQHHALTAFGNAIIDDEQGFRLADPAATWLFPRVKQTAPLYYPHWLNAFANA